MIFNGKPTIHLSAQIYSHDQRPLQSDHRLAGWVAAVNPIRSVLPKLLIWGVVWCQREESPGMAEMWVSQKNYLLYVSIYLVI